MPMRARKLHARRGNVFHKSKLDLKVREVKVLGSNYQKSQQKNS